MREETDLLELITKDGGHIGTYLGDVLIEDFIEDVKRLAIKNIDKVIIESTIEKLKQLL